MTATNHTEHYELSQYTKADRPTYTGDYNTDMSKIDAAIYAASQAGGMTTVKHTADLTGDGTTNSPLGVADTIARTEDIPSLDGYATTESVTQAIATAIADRLTAGDIKPGNGINVEASGNQVTISYVGGGSAGGLTAVAHDDTLTGEGTSASPLGVEDGTALRPRLIDSTSGITDINNLIKDGWYGIWFDLGQNLPSNMPPKILNPAYVRASLLILNNGYNGTLGTPTTQVWFNRGGDSGDAFIAMRLYTENSWKNWVTLASLSDIPDTSALTSRIVSLESQVTDLSGRLSELSAALPSASGLTAAQLDGMGVDDYNIVRVGTPTHSMETEETSYE